MLKYCYNCKNYKTVENFNKNKRTKDGLQTQCSGCRKNYRILNKKEIAEKHKTYYSENREQLIARSKDYAETNKEKVKQYKKEYFQKNKEKYKDYYDNNKDKINKTKRKHRELNKEQYTNYNREYSNIKRKTDIQYKLRVYLRNRLNKALKNNYKAGSAVKDLGCSISEFKLYLESKFQEGMSWDNYGKWHIDHIKPLSKFDLMNREQLLMLCHYTNLQPLWAEDNLKKHNK